MVTKLCTKMKKESDGVTSLEITSIFCFKRFKLCWLTFKKLFVVSYNFFCKYVTCQTLCSILLLFLFKLFNWFNALFYVLVFLHFKYSVIFLSLLITLRSRKVFTLVMCIQFGKIMIFFFVVLFFWLNFY